MTEQVVARRLVISGRVQGVGFRWFVARRAQQLGLAGWVRNLPDGRVETVAMGEEGAVASFIAAVERGPSMAHVENVDKAEIPHDGIDYKSFNIR
jgi:acylphosphatase